jgi:rSAM/selenodomain-associated transferase 1
MTTAAAPTIARSVLIFMKSPEPGRVKTRLARALGAKQAAALYRDWIGFVLGLLQPLRNTTRLVGYFDGPLEAFHEWHALADDWRPQPSGDLGERLLAGFEWEFKRGGTVLAVGTDCVEIDADLLLQAFEILSQHDVVFGPTPDGGYYLIGLSMLRPALFRSIRWSSRFTLADHLRCCRDQGWATSFLPIRHDIDTENDWHEYLARTGQGSAPLNPGNRHPRSE